MTAAASRLWRWTWMLAVPLACTEPTAPPEAAPSVQVEPVVAHRVREQMEATGELVARSQAQVAAQVEGQITGIRVDEGAELFPGEVIIEIDPERREIEHRNEGARLAEARVELADAERELRRIESLHGQGAVSAARLDEARTAVRLARARREGASARRSMTKRALRDSSVVAPFGGLLVRRFVHEGEFVSVGDPLFEMVALDPLEVEFHVAERDSSRIAEGASVEVAVTPHPDRVFPAIVTMISPAIDPGSRTLRVKGEVPNPERLLRPGLFARVEVAVGERDDVPMIAREAVLQRADGSVVFRLAGEDRVERRVVRLGVVDGDRIEVVEGLSLGDRVLIRGHARLADGARVSLRDAEGRPLGAGVAGGPADLALGPAEGRP